jgi:hypothetical protein
MSELWKTINEKKENIPKLNFLAKWLVATIKIHEKKSRMSMLAYSMEAIKKHGLEKNHVQRK